MIMNKNITRRALVKGGLIAGVLVPVAGLCVSSDASAASAALDPSDPAAKPSGTSPNQRSRIKNAALAASFKVRREMGRAPAQFSLGRL
jgi:hypothetical protein